MKREADGDEGAALALAALRLVGAPFRLHGRDPQSGIDCVGLCVASLRAIGRQAHVPADYALHNVDLRGLLRHARPIGLVPATGAVRPGDIILARISPLQVHVVIAIDGTDFVHAHAGLRRVVRSPGPLTWPMAAHWRLAATTKE